MNDGETTDYIMPGWVLELDTDIFSDTENSLTIYEGIGVGGMPISCYSGPVICPAGIDQGPLPENINWTLTGYYFTAGNHYTLEICDSFGDGNLPYTITDLLTGTEFLTGTFSFTTAGECFVVIFGPLEGTVAFSGPGVTNNDNGYGSFDPTGLTCGTYTVTYSFDNGIGCAGSASQDITVLDNESPVLDTIPVDITIECSIDIPSMPSLNWTDNCDGSGTLTGAETQHRLMPGINYQDMELYGCLWQWIEQDPGDHLGG